MINMKIWKHAGKTHFQLKDLEDNVMLFDFSIATEWEEELVRHMIRKLSDYLIK